MRVTELLKAGRYAVILQNMQASGSIKSFLCPDGRLLRRWFLDDIILPHLLIPY